MQQRAAGCGVLDASHDCDVLSQISGHRLEYRSQRGHLLLSQVLCVNLLLIQVLCVNSLWLHGEERRGSRKLCAIVHEFCV